MMNWLEYRKELLGRIGELGKLSPDTLAGYQTLSRAGQKTGHLDAKTRELIALAVAVTTRCDGCITVHTGEALKHGATREEIAEALGVSVGDGPTLSRHGSGNPGPWRGRARSRTAVAGRVEANGRCTPQWPGSV